jgi:hypothetical protein
MEINRHLVAATVKCIGIGAFAISQFPPPPSPSRQGRGFQNPPPLRGREGWGGSQSGAQALMSTQSAVGKALRRDLDREEG